MCFMKLKPSSASFLIFFLRVQTILILAILVLPVHPIYAQDNKNDWTNDKLVGKVQSVAESFFRTTEKFGEVVKDKIGYEVVNAYNKQGYLQSKYFQNPIKSTNSRTHCTYKKNLLTEVRDEDNGKLTVQKSLFDANDRVIEMNDYDRDGIENAGKSWRFRSFYANTG